MTLSDFKTYVKLDLVRTDKDIELVQAYNDMIMWVALQMPHGDYKFQSYASTSISVEDTPLPTNLIHLLHPIRLLDGSESSDSGYPLTHITKAEYDKLQPNPNRTSPSTGKPVNYTIWSRSILLDPVPDSADYILEINWSKRPTALSADSATSSLGSEWDEVLKFGTLERVFAGLGMTEEADFWGNKYHRIDPRTGDDMPVGICAKLLEIEEDREGFAVGKMNVNSL